MICRETTKGLRSVGDARDDQNLIVAQLHVVFLMYHNRVLEELRIRGTEVPLRARGLSEALYLSKHVGWLHGTTGTSS